MNLQVSIAIFRLFDGDLLPGSKMIFIIMTSALLLGCYKFLKQGGVNRRMALMGLLILITTPVIFYYSTLGYGNLPFTVNLILGILWSLEGVFKNKNDSIVIGGSLLAFAAWTRPEGIGFSSIIIITILLVALILYKIKLSLKQLIAFISPMILFPTTWFILLGGREMARDEIGGTIRDFLPLILHGNFQIPYLLSVAKYSFSFFTSWRNAGYFWLIFIVLGTTLFILIKPRNKSILPIFICLLLTFLVPIGMFYVASFPALNNYDLFLGVSYGRAMLPAFVLLVFLGTLIIGSIFPISDNLEA
jgi:hypothetical protein